MISIFVIHGLYFSDGGAVSCPQLEQCWINNGTCEKDCDGYKGQRELIGLCIPSYPHYSPTTYGKPVCKCCAAKCQNSPACSAMGGVCVDAPEHCPLRYGFMVGDGCTGYNCKCCKPGE